MRACGGVCICVHSDFAYVYVRVCVCTSHLGAEWVREVSARQLPCGTATFAATMAYIIRW